MASYASQRSGLCSLGWQEWNSRITAVVGNLRKDSDSSRVPIPFGRRRLLTSLRMPDNLAVADKPKHEHRAKSRADAG